MTDDLTFVVAAGKVTIYEDAAHEWRWKLTASNGEQLAQGESHRDRHDALRAARRATLGEDADG